MINEKLLKTWDLKSQIKAYEYGQRSNWDNPNSVDSKGITESTNLFAYILKYMSKGSDARKLEGRLFGYSDGLRALRPFDDTIDQETSMFLNELVDDENIRKYSTDYATIFEGIGLNVKVWENKPLAKKMLNHYMSCYYELYGR